MPVFAPAHFSDPAHTMLKELQAFTPSFTQAWTLLGIAIALEVMGTTCMKLSQGFTRPVPSVAMFAFYALAFSCNTMPSRRWI